MDDFVKVATVEAVSEKGLAVEHGGRRIAVFRDGESYFALEDICPHMGAFLSHGYRRPGRIICPWHNWEFDLETGACVSNNTGACVQTFPVQVVNGDILLPVLAEKEWEDEFEE